MAATLADGDVAAATTYAKQLLNPEHRPVSRSVVRLLRAGIECQPRDQAESTRHLLRVAELGDGRTLTSQAATPTAR